MAANITIIKEQKIPQKLIHFNETTHLNSFVFYDYFCLPLEKGQNGSFLLNFLGDNNLTSIDKLRCFANKKDKEFYVPGFWHKSLLRSIIPILVLFSVPKFKSYKEL